MKKLSLLLLLGIFSTTCLTAAARKKGPAKRKTATVVQEEEEANKSAPTASTSTSTAEQEEKRSKVEEKVQRDPSPTAMREVVASAPEQTTELTWEEACKKSINEASLRQILESGVVQFKRKQVEIRDYLIEQGFSPLVAACFVAFDFNDLQELLPENVSTVLENLLKDPAYVPNAQPLNLVDFFKNKIAPFMFLALNGRCINGLLKWVVTRIEMFTTAEKRGTGLHTLLISGVGAPVIEACAGSIEAVKVAAIEGCPTYGACALMSQSLATVEACVTTTILTQEEARAFHLSTQAEDMAALQRLGMESMLSRFNIGEVADNLDIDDFIRSLNLRAFTTQAAERASSLQPQATGLVNSLKLGNFIAKISSFATLNLILDKLAEAELLTSKDLMRLGAKLTALGAARGASRTLGSARSYLGSLFGSGDQDDDAGEAV